MNIGAKIKQLRLKNNLTLEELASRTELTKGFLSQLENDASSPSVATLEDIVIALGSDMSNFFKEIEPIPITFNNNDYIVDDKDGLRKTYVVPNAQKNEMEPIVIDISPGYKSDVIEPFDGEEFGYILKGKVNLVIDHEVYALKKGETFYLHGNKTHYLENISNDIAQILWLTTPPTF